MKKGLLVLVLSVVAGCMAFCVMRWWRSADHHGGSIMQAMPELEWLQRDLNLNDGQLVQVRDLHAAYRPQCEAMCRRIAEAHVDMDRIAKSTRSLTPEFTAALKAHADVHLECQESMLRHLYRTAAVLDEKQASRYLETMLPFALEFTWSEPGNHHAR